MFLTAGNIIAQIFLSHLSSVPVRHSAPVRLRAGALRRQGGAPEAADVELVPSPGVGQHRSPGRPPPG